MIKYRRKIAVSFGSPPSENRQNCSGSGRDEEVLRWFLHDADASGSLRKTKQQRAFEKEMTNGTKNRQSSTTAMNFPVICQAPPQMFIGVF